MQLFNVWKKFDELNLTIKCLWAVIIILALLDIFLVAGWMNSPSRMRVYLPPDLTQGAMIKPGAIPKSTIYAFGYQIFTAINTWTDEGATDYKKNLNAYKNYLSSRFYRELLEDYATRAANGSLGRQRLVTGVSNHRYSPQDVKILGDGIWLLDLHLKIQETVDGSVVKDVVMDYPLIISRIRTSIQVNPWGLAITGYNKEPRRIKTNI
jgi:integrating conjugative element protein (TIGR03746 family)